jgi:hypothetical protein
MDIEKGARYGTVFWYVNYERLTRCAKNSVEICCGTLQTIRDGRLATGSWSFPKRCDVSGVRSVGRGRQSRQPNKGRLGPEQVPKTHSQVPRRIFQFSQVSLIRNILLNAILS